MHEKPQIVFKQTGVLLIIFGLKRFYSTCFHSNLLRKNTVKGIEQSQLKLCTSDIEWKKDWLLMFLLLVWFVLRCFIFSCPFLNSLLSNRLLHYLVDNSSFCIESSVRVQYDEA